MGENKKTRLAPNFVTTNVASKQRGNLICLSNFVLAGGAPNLYAFIRTCLYTNKDVTVGKRDTN